MIIEEDSLMHYGTPRRSGRYPWGSGGNILSSRNSKSFLDHIADMRAQGVGDTDIARGLGMSTTEFRDLRSIANNRQKQADIAYAQRLKEKGYSNVEIGKKMNGKNESSVRALLSAGLKDKQNILETTANMLKEEVAAKKVIDVGSGVELHLGISAQKLKAALTLLREEGYALHNVQIEQLGTNNQKTNVKVLAAPGTTYRDIVTDRGQIKSITKWSEDGGRTMLGINKPLDISSKRLAIRYAEDGGGDADGVIYVRPGVEDLSLGKSRYAQVRISVDGTHYLKGMAMHNDDLPKGVDLLFNTNKSNTGNKLDALKPQTGDVDNPFGAVVRQLPKLDAKGNPIEGTVRSAMNIVNEEGNWEQWSKSLSTQMLSKQRPALIESQLGQTYETRLNQLNEIRNLTNPSVRKKLLEDFASDADSASVHLKAAAIKGQGTHVILPINTLKETEIYAPNYRNGDRVVLIRYPHGGKFEIPELTVNNNHRPAKLALGDAKDAVGINSNVAKRLSGADFDGDTVLVIPNKQRGKKRIETEPALAGLKNFDPQTAYPAHEGMRKMTPRDTGIEMGLISNLITDMTIKGANSTELAQAVRHSMVVIDAEKHSLNYKQSELDNGIKRLRVKYQGQPQGGTTTLISIAGSKVDIPKRVSRGIDPKTGKIIYEETAKTYVNKQGKTVKETVKVKKLSNVEDANIYNSGTEAERLYADHSNKLKRLADDARKEMVNTKGTPRLPSSAKTYSSEVSSLDAKLTIALRNRPRERNAQIIANSVLAAKKAANPDMDKEEIKKIKFLALEEARIRAGAGKDKIEITDKEWTAIQAGAISPSKLQSILDNSDMDRVKHLATPRKNTVMTTAKQRRAATMLASGYTQAEVADALGVALSTLKTSIYS